MRRHQLFGDGQPQPGAAGAAVPGRIHPVQAVKYIGQRIRRDARPGIRYRYAQAGGRAAIAFAVAIAGAFAIVIGRGMAGYGY